MERKFTVPPVTIEALYTPAAPTFFITNRAHAPETRFMYSSQESSTELSYGFCPVQFKKSSSLNDFSWCFSEELMVLRQFGQLGAELYDRLSPVHVLPPTEFDKTDSPNQQLFAAIRQELHRTRNWNMGQTRIAVFTPGFFHGFEGAVERGGILRHFLRRLGYASVVLDWASKGTLIPDYWLDDKRVDAAKSLFKPILLELANEFGAENIVLVQHSLGNKMICEILSEFAAELGENAPKFRLNFMVAPDVGLKAFQEKYVDGVRTCVREKGILILGSEFDRLLPISDIIHAPLSDQVKLALKALLPWVEVHVDPRIGELQKIPGFDGIREVDYSNYDDRLFGHVVPYVLIPKYVLAQMLGQEDTFGGFAGCDIAQVEQNKLRYTVDPRKFAFGGVI